MSPKNYIYDLKFCYDLVEYQRKITKEINIGGIPIGGKHPIRIQSMVNTNPLDIGATTNQIIELYRAGCDYVRLTVPSIKAAKGLKEIKNSLKERNINVPLIADVHFNPKIAEMAAGIIEKVRINPGNYAVINKPKVTEYIDEEYKAELERIQTILEPLIKICKQRGTVIRVGTNHGSLSERIMNRFGDTPAGMVESALEFVRIFRNYEFHNIILAMKASNPAIMIDAYRLLITQMLREGMNYPIHLGVTEAGEAEDGIIKSAIGIGSLLEDGIGDTIRVSLTGNPINEIPVAKKIIKRYSKRTFGNKAIDSKEGNYSKFLFEKQTSIDVENIGGIFTPIVICDLSNLLKIDNNFYEDFGYKLDVKTDNLIIEDNAPDYFYLGKQRLKLEIPEPIKVIYDYQTWPGLKNKARSYPVFSEEQFLSDSKKSEKLNFLLIKSLHLNKALIDKLKTDKTVVLLIEVNNNSVHAFRKFVIDLKLNNINNPYIFKGNYDTTDWINFTIDASIDIGVLLVDKLGNGIFLSELKNSCSSDEDYRKNIINRNQLSFDILQASKRRIFKTEYVICPSCGRCLFDIEKTASIIKEKTKHLKGLKIGIMGCVVNGIGEMGDVDYGFVGSGINKISLYRNKDLVKKNIDSDSAILELINLLKADGKWIPENKIISDNQITML